MKLPDLAATAERLLGTRLTALITLIALIGFAALAFGAQADTRAMRGPVYGLSPQLLAPHPDTAPAPPAARHTQASLRGMQPGS